MKLRPVLDLVIVRPTPAPKTRNGIYIPESAEDDNPTSRVGEVLAVGPGRMTEHGAVIVPTVDKGDTIVFRKFSGFEVEVDGERYLLLPAGDILVIAESS